ncbi:TrkA family potassium uptake protein [Nonomuraea sp. NPDC049709]|uniref:potassium channel family protein n=1 Tax=Nonomuraea sp. NPDC049709 TaxID=3154736 RepID=UPI00342B06E2
MLETDSVKDSASGLWKKVNILTQTNSVAVLGLGRFGSAVALSLASSGENVLGIDRDSETVRSLTDRLHRIAVADATDLETLRRLGIGEVEQAVVAIGQDVAASVLTTSLLAELDVQKIWARAMTYRHALILERMGAHRVVLPQQDMGKMLAGLLISGGPAP